MTRRTTVVLGTGSLLLTAVVAAEAWYLWGSPSPDPTAQLIQLSETQGVGVIDNDGIDIRDIDA